MANEPIPYVFDVDKCGGLPRLPRLPRALPLLTCTVDDAAGIVTDRSVEPPYLVGGSKCRHGGCTWVWDGAVWTLASIRCDTGYECAEMLLTGSTIGQEAETCCKQDPSVTTTTSTTSTTTTPGPHCCDRFRAYPYVEICDNERIRLTETSPGVWTYSGLTTCGDEMVLRVDCDPLGSGCGSFTIFMNYPCSVPQRITGQITECLCTTDPFVPPLNFRWVAVETLDTSACACCNDVDPTTSTTTTSTTTAPLTSTTTTSGLTSTTTTSGLTSTTTTTPPTTSTTTTPLPTSCSGTCRWVWDSVNNELQWVLIENSCQGFGCGCPDPPAYTPGSVGTEEAADCVSS